VREVKKDEGGELEGKKEKGKRGKERDDWKERMWEKGSGREVG